MKRLLLWAAGGAAAVLILLQLVPVNRANPAVTREVKWNSPQTKELARRACMDCHSNETVWPWYGNIAPASLLLSSHVVEGRSRLNFSEWDKPNSDYQEVERNMNRGSMPTWDYMMIHAEARLSADEKARLLTGLKTTFDNDPPIARQQGDFGG